MIKIFLPIILAFFFLIEIFFPSYYFSQNEKFEFEKSFLKDTISISVNLKNEFFQKEYLMPNGKYIDEKNNNYISNYIPPQIYSLSKDFSNRIDSNILLASWIVLSNWGQYSAYNNPFGIDFKDVKKVIPSFPNTSLVLTKKDVLIKNDSSIFYQKSFYKMASFSSLKESFDVYSQIYNFLILDDSVKNVINKISVDLNKKNINRYKNIVDTNKIRLYQKDTISLNDSNFVIKSNKINEYNKIYIPVLLLLVFVIVIMYQIRYDKSV